jgi:hypothetical protein
MYGRKTFHCPPWTIWVYITYLCIDCNRVGGYQYFGGTCRFHLLLAARVVLKCMLHNPLDPKLHSANGDLSFYVRMVIILLPVLTFSNPTFCSYNVFMGFVLFSE